MAPGCIPVSGQESPSSKAVALAVQQIVITQEGR